MFAPTPDAASAVVKRRAILIADDEEAICFSLSRRARRFGLESLIASDGSRAVALAAWDGVVAAILDVRMPGLDGVSAALVIRRMHPHIPLALMTASTDRGLVAPIADADVRLFRKPFGLETFSDWLAEIVPLMHAVNRVGEMGQLPGPAGAA